MPRPLPDITQKIEYAAAPSLDDVEDDFEEDVSTQTGPTNKSIWNTATGITFTRTRQM